MFKSHKEKMLEHRISRLEKLIREESKSNKTCSRDSRRSLMRGRYNEGSSWFNAFQIDDIKFNDFTIKPKNNEQVVVSLKGAKISCVSANGNENSLDVDDMLLCSDIELVLTYIGQDEDLYDDVTPICDIAKDIDLSGDKTLMVGGGYFRKSLDSDVRFDVVNGFSYSYRYNTSATVDIIDKEGFTNSFEIDSMTIRGCDAFEDISQQLSDPEGSYYDVY